MEIAKNEVWVEFTSFDNNSLDPEDSIIYIKDCETNELIPLIIDKRAIDFNKKRVIAEFVELRSLEYEEIYKVVFPDQKPIPRAKKISVKKIFRV